MKGEQWMLFALTLVRHLRVSHKVLGKLMKYGLDEQTVRWTENRPNNQAERVLIILPTSSWWPVTSVSPRSQYLV